MPALGGPQHPLGGVTALRDADLRIANLECVIASSGEQGVDKGESGPYYYRARPEMAAVLVAASIDVVATANNHSGDYGPEALLEQKAHLQAAGIGAAGSGRTLDEAFAPVLRQVRGVRIALFSVDSTQPHFAATDARPGTAWLPPQDPAGWHRALAPRIAAARLQADVVLIAVHWGRNQATAPDAQQIALGHALVDAGADAVLGASAHVLQGVEVYRGRPILHDAGDLLFDAIFATPRDGGLFLMDLTARGVERVHFHPLRLGFGHSESARGDDVAAASLRFAAQCVALGTPTTVVPGTGCVIELAPPERPVATHAPSPAAVDGRPRTPVPLASPRAGWTVDSVPADAVMAPVQLGPLRLIGVRCTPDAMDRRQMLWVESWWCIDAPVQDDLRLLFLARPTPGSRMPAWGLGMDHDPCDWMWPTRRWQPGRIYRDRYGLRPPARRLLVDDLLQLEVQVIGGEASGGPVALPIWRRLRAMSESSMPARVPAASATPDDVVKTWSAAQLAEVTGGHWLVPPPADWHVRSVVRGPRHIGMREAPTLFVASDHLNVAAHEAYTRPRTQAWDHHKRLPELQRVLAGAIVARQVEGLRSDFPLLQVDDPIGALIALGAAARARFQGKVVAVTGTAGKSSTVSMVGHLAPAGSRVLTTIDNYNSRVGVPAMLASLAADDDLCVLEMAQSALWMTHGPISTLARPHVSIVTEIGLSQTATTATLEGTADFKSRIFQGLERGGTAIFGAHIPCFDRVHSAARRTAGDILVVGTGNDADVRIAAAQAEAGGCRMHLVLRGRRVDYFFPVASVGLLRNSALAMAAAFALGFDLQDAAARMASVQLPGAVLERAELRTRKGVQATLIDDSWNAEVLSMVNAMDYASRYEPATAARVRRRIAVLGRIVNLGTQAEAMHRGLAQPLLKSRIELVLTHGKEMRWLRDELPSTRLGPHFDTADAVVRYLDDELRNGDLLLLKGDRVESDFGDIAGRLRAL